jgi:hypothetical protein
VVSWLATWQIVLAEPSGQESLQPKDYHLIDLVKYVPDKHGTLEAHDDVPDLIREQLMQRSKRGDEVKLGRLCL